MRFVEGASLKVSGSTEEDLRLFVARCQMLRRGECERSLTMEAKRALIIVSSAD